MAAVENQPGEQPRTAIPRSVARLLPCQRHPATASFPKQAARLMTNGTL
jgi:hypothetical protein